MAFHVELSVLNWLLAVSSGHPKKDKNKNKAEGKEPPDPYIAQEPPWEAVLAESNINNVSVLRQICASFCISFCRLLAANLRTMTSASASTSGGVSGVCWCSGIDGCLPLLASDRRAGSAGCTWCALRTLSTWSWSTSLEPLSTQAAGEASFSSTIWTLPR